MSILSIGIPTFNRIQTLRKMIDFFQKEGAFDDTSIEFIISDNCSTDGTYDFLSELKAIYPSIVINTNSKNIGAEGNFSKIVELASSEYVWIVGDDDVLCSGIIKEVVHLINKYTPSWIFLRHSFIKEEEIVIPKLECDDYYERGIDLFNLICQSDYKLGGMMFVSASIHCTCNALECVGIYSNSEEKDNKNMALTLGLAFYSSLSGSACVTSNEVIMDNCCSGDWTSKIIKVNCRDQIAILDLFARIKDINLLKDTKFENGLLYDCPEWRYLRTSFKENNAAMSFYFKHKPIKVITDLILLIGRRIGG